jgi:hypothetical protein
MFAGPVLLPSSSTPYSPASPVRAVSGDTVVSTPLAMSPMLASGKAFVGYAPLPDTPPGYGLRFPYRVPRVLLRTVEVGGYETLDLAAGQTLSGHRIVTLQSAQVFYASRTNLATMDGIIGITLGAANTGDMVQVRTGGEVSEPSWNWTSGGDIFLDTNGLLTQTVPPDVAGTYLLRCGVAIDATTIFLDLEEPILF